MALSEIARENHDALFPQPVSGLSATDPELVEYFGNFAFDEVLRSGDLEPRTRLIVQLSALIGSGSLREFRILLGGALTIGLTPVEAKEMVYQSVAYVGMGRAIDFVHATNDVLTERGVELPLAGQSTTTPDDRAEKGLAVQKQIVGADASTPCTPKPPQMSSTSSNFCPPTASGTTTPAPDSTSRPGNWSPWRS